MLLVLAGGAVMSAAVLRRIEEVSQTSRDIVNGDLGRRIALNGSGDEFDHLAASLNSMLDRITALMEDLKQVSVDVAHDLRTPLTRLRQRLELAQGSASGSGRLQSTIGEALVDIDGILQTFSALLRISQIESGHRRANFGPVDVADIIDTVVDLYQPVIEDKSQQLVVRQDRELSLHGDRELLIQMLVNLVENASHHSPAGARIAVASRRRADAVVLTVADDGPGIPAAYRAKVLHRFFRLDVSRSTPGNGLGLCLVDAVSTLHGAGLTLQDNHPGLEVSIVFPSFTDRHARRRRNRQEPHPCTTRRSGSSGRACPRCLRH
ncbi:sensor histidine kinase [Xanthomonas theicola]|uniref:sensor histidine kinase n=1 Tax=Xanthomonas theicola TaxID=56464 RepID=UPI0036238C4E